MAKRGLFARIFGALLYDSGYNSFRKNSYRQFKAARCWLITTKSLTFVKNKNRIEHDLPLFFGPFCKRQSLLNHARFTRNSQDLV
jgi:hypothetical protein